MLKNSIPRKSTMLRDYHFLPSHVASLLLEEDVKNGNADVMPPSELK